MGLLNVLLWGVPTLVTLLITFILYNLHSHKKFFKKHNIPYMGAGFTRFVRLLLGKVSLVQAERETYEEAIKCNAPIVGFTNLFAGSRGLYLADMETMKNVYVKDFDHFINRPPFPGGDKNFYIAKMLFALENEQWKGLRSKMTPMFTTGKIKRMFGILCKSSENMTSYLNKHIGRQSEIDITPIFTKYTMDTIAGTAFAFDSKAWEVPLGKTSTFEDMGNRWQFQFTGATILKFLLMFLSPKLFDLLKLELLDAKAEKYFVDTVKHVVKQRRQGGQRSEDFLQLMLDLQDGVLKADEVEQEGLKNTPRNSPSAKITFDDDDVIANALLFLSAGFETTHSVLCFVVYALTINPDVQEKLWDEVNAKMSANGGKLCYEDLLEMNYLDMVVNETLRMYSPNPRTERICTKDYLVPGTNFTIEKGSQIAIPMYPSQFDERYFPDPDKFIPERFTPENKATRSPYAYMPFGHGPRGCIATRFALIMVKAAIANMVYSFQFSPSAKTKIPMEYDQTVSLKPKGGLWLMVTSRK